MEYDYYEYETHHFNCENCGWHGVGAEAEEEDVTNSLVEIICPACYNRLGYYYWPKKAKE